MNHRHFIIKSIRHLYQKVFTSNKVKPFNRISNPQEASDLIYNQLISDQPCMIARFGALELSTIVNYLGVQQGCPSIKEYIVGNASDWWWNRKLLKLVMSDAGFFPTTPERLKQFCELMIHEATKVDILGSWLDGERYLDVALNKASFVEAILLEPFWADSPWTKALEGKKILLVHPFDQSIQSQYLKREKLFQNKDVLPEFELLTFKPVQTAGGSSEFSSWFDALDYMKSEIVKIDYDICLLACGSYGFPLAAYIKDTGKKAVHLGGVLQLLFGIKGNRWENPDYDKQHDYTKLMNEYWVKPSGKERPENAEMIEGACYW